MCPSANPFGQVLVALVTPFTADGEFIQYAERSPATDHHRLLTGRSWTSSAMISGFPEAAAITMTTFCAFASGLSER